MQRRTLVALALLPLPPPLLPLRVRRGPVKSASPRLQQDGPFGAYGKQTQTGLLMGLNYHRRHLTVLAKAGCDRERRPGQA